jgi:hypothetical protein
MHLSSDTRRRKRPAKATSPHSAPPRPGAFKTPGEATDEMRATPVPPGPPSPSAPPNVREFGADNAVATGGLLLRCDSGNRTLQGRAGCRCRSRAAVRRRAGEKHQPNSNQSHAAHVSGSRALRGWADRFKAANANSSQPVPVARRAKVRSSAQPVRQQKRRRLCESVAFVATYERAACCLVTVRIEFRQQLFLAYEL